MKKYTLLCLGDSYTIGEAVDESGRFPNQAVTLLNDAGYAFDTPTIIAKTGWTTDELIAAIQTVNLQGSFDFVTLLIGVNNQYRLRSLDNYAVEFTRLLQIAVNYTGGNNERVVVISIPDWGVTNFVAQDAQHRTAQEISAQIDAFNAVNRKVTEEKNVAYIDITPASRDARNDVTLIASDGLHPSEKMYAQWAEAVASFVIKQLTDKNIPRN